MAVSCAASTAVRFGRMSARASIIIRRGEWIDTTSPPRRAFSPVTNPEQGWVRAENGLTRNYFHDFLFLPAVKSDEKPTMILATADQSPGFWRRENRGARAALFKSADGAESWTRITNGLADDLDSMIWALVHHPTDHRSVFAGFGNVARGHASGSGGAGDLMVSRDMGESWQRLNIDLPADRGALGGGGLISTACFSGSGSKRSSASHVARRLD